MEGCFGGHSYIWVCVCFPSVLNLQCFQGLSAWKAKKRYEKAEVQFLLPSGLMRCFRGQDLKEMRSPLVASEHLTPRKSNTAEIVNHNYIRLPLDLSEEQCSLLASTWSPNVTLHFFATSL